MYVIKRVYYTEIRIIIESVIDHHIEKLIRAIP